jgi:O-succinylbenzoic acid--CoA ligase
LISDKEFKYKGRIDFVINSGGVKINPEEVENKLRPYMGFRFIVCGIKDESLGEKAVLVYENKSALPEDDLMLKIEQAQLNPYETPRQIYRLPAFPETTNGKLARDQIIRKMNQLTA